MKCDLLTQRWARNQKSLNIKAKCDSHSESVALNPMRLQRKIHGSTSESADDAAEGESADDVAPLEVEHAGPSLSAAQHQAG